MSKLLTAGELVIIAVLTMTPAPFAHRRRFMTAAFRRERSPGGGEYRGYTPGIGITLAGSYLTANGKGLRQETDNLRASRLVVE